MAQNGGSAGRTARRGLATVVADTAATGPSLALIVALGVIAIPAAITFLRRRRAPRHI